MDINADCVHLNIQIVIAFVACLTTISSYNARSFISSFNCVVLYTIQCTLCKLYHAVTTRREQPFLEGLGTDPLLQ